MNTCEDWCFYVIILLSTKTSEPDIGVKTDWLEKQRRSDPVTSFLSFSLIRKDVASFLALLTTSVSLFMSEIPQNLYG